MFPQLFQRFFAAESEHSIARMMLFYPLICTIVFFSPIAVGVLGHLSFPDLAGKQADRILPMVAAAVSGDLVSTLVIAAGLAALMSTMDSQLLTLSSVFTRDVLPLFRGREATTSLPGRLFVICLSLAGLAFAYSPPATILQIATQAFTGLAVLFPTVFFGLYLKRVFPAAAVFSILSGEAAVVCFHLKWLPTGSLLPVVWVMLISFGVYLGIHFFVCLIKEGRQQMHAPDWLLDRHVLLQIAVFILAMDFWVWGKAQPMVLGVPFWIVYFVLLSGLQTAFMAFLIRREHG